MGMIFNRQVLPYWFVLIFAPPGNGKSLEQARLSDKVFTEYHRMEKRYPTLPHRILMSNQRLNEKLTHTEGHEHGHYMYWEAPEELRYCPRKDCWKGALTHINHDVDIFVDEGSTLFPADDWASTPIWLRKLWAQHRHNGIRIVMLTQDFQAIDINCRRMLWQAYYMKKVIGSRDISATLPPLVPWTITNFLNPWKSVVWGVYTKRRFDPIVMKNDPLSMLTLQLSEKKNEDMQKLRLVGSAELHLITWFKVSLYDTTQNVKEVEPIREIDHIQVACKHPNCGYVHKTHKLK